MIENDNSTSTNKTMDEVNRLIEKIQMHFGLGEITSLLTTNAITSYREMLLISDNKVKMMNCRSEYNVIALRSEMLVGDGYVNSLLQDAKDDIHQDGRVLSHANLDVYLRQLNVPHLPIKMYDFMALFGLSEKWQYIMTLVRLKYQNEMIQNQQQLIPIDISQLSALYTADTLNEYTFQILMCEPDNWLSAKNQLEGLYADIIEDHRSPDPEHHLITDSVAEKVSDVLTASCLTYSISKNHYLILIPVNEYRQVLDKPESMKYVFHLKRCRSLAVHVSDSEVLIIKENGVRSSQPEHHSVDFINYVKTVFVNVS